MIRRGTACATEAQRARQASSSPERAELKNIATMHRDKASTSCLSRPAGGASSPPILALAQWLGQLSCRPMRFGEPLTALVVAAWLILEPKVVEAQVTGAHLDVLPPANVNRPLGLALKIHGALSPK
jgi:hypothetical protein